VQFYDAEISNVFFPLNGLVTLTPLWGKVQIDNSVFSRISICGAIIKNYYKDLASPSLELYVNSEKLS